MWIGTPTPTYTYQWKADSVVIAGATALSYVLTNNEIGKVITVTVTATNSAGSASATSLPTDAVIAGALALLHGETAGFAADFTYSDTSKQIVVKGHTSGNGYYAPDDFFLTAGSGPGGPKRYTDITGARVWTSYNYVPRSEDFTQSWTTGGTSIVVTAHTLQDNTAASTVALFSPGIPTVTGATYTATFTVLKDTDQTAFPAFYLLSSTQAMISLNTQTGAASDAAGNTIHATYSVEDTGTHWKLKVTFVAGTTQVQMRLYPAYSTILGGAAAATAVRTVEIDSVQLNKGSVPTGYLATLAAARYGVAEDFDPVTHLSRGLLIENFARTNLLLNTYTDLVTQDVTVTAIPYTLSFYGTGTVTLSGVSTAGPLVGTGANDRVTLTFTPTAGTLTVTVSGTVSEAQLEAGSAASSQIPTWSSSITRGADNTINIALTSIPDLGSEWMAYIDFIYTSPVGAGQYILTFDNGTLAEKAAISIDSTLPYVYVTDNNISQASISQVSNVLVNVRNEITVRFKTNAIAGSVNGSPIGAGQDTSATMPTPTFLRIGGYVGGGNGPTGAFYLRRLVIVPRGISNTNLADWRYTRTISNDTYDVFLVAGQSNVYNGTPLDPAIDISGGKVFQMSQVGVVSAADEPLLHPLPAAGSIGFALPFARDYYVTNSLESGRNVLLLPYGVGNTGFSDNRWNVGDDLYNGADSLTAVALAKYPNAVLKGILWMQGEKEAMVPWTQTQYATAFDTMVTGFRTDFGDMPIIVGGMSPGWLGTNVTYQPVQNALIDTPNRLSNSAYANPAAPTDLSNGIMVHYSAAGDRLFGGRYWTAYSSLSGVYSVGSDSINPSGSIRIFSDGKYRYTTATSSAISVNFSVAPPGGYWTGDYDGWLDISNITWNTSGTYSKSWVASSTTATTTVYTIGNLLPSANYTIAVDGLASTTHTSNDSGVITYTYTGGYSTHTFTVTDTTIPTVSVTAPTNSSTITGSSVTLTATASDAGSGLAGVQFKLDTNTLIGAEGASSPYSVTWNSTAVSDGTHTIIAVARDAAGNYATSTAVTITVDNTPPVLSAGLPSGSLAAGTTNTTLSLSTNESALCKYGSTANVAYASIANSFSATSTAHSATISGLSNGNSYNYYVRCQDNAGNTDSSDYTIFFSVNSGDSVIFLAPPASPVSPTQTTAPTGNINNPPQPSLVREGENMVNAVKPIVVTLGQIQSEAEQIMGGKAEDRITNFITNGTPTTLTLGSGERAGVVNSFQSAFGKPPKTESDWSDILKIANGRWPSQRNTTAEDKAIINFKKVYLRNSVKSNSHDDVAITIMTYGLRPANRNLTSERAAIKSFRAVYGHAPKNATAWDIVRAIAYSGARR